MWDNDCPVRIMAQWRWLPWKVARDEAGKARQWRLG
jgi:hypothetical protein